MELEKKPPTDCDRTISQYFPRTEMNALLARSGPSEDPPLTFRSHLHEHNLMSSDCRRPLFPGQVFSSYWDFLDFTNSPEGLSSHTVDHILDLSRSYNGHIRILEVLYCKFAGLDSARDKLRGNYYFRKGYWISSEYFPPFSRFHRARRKETLHGKEQDKGSRLIGPAQHLVSYWRYELLEDMLAAGSLTRLEDVLRPATKRRSVNSDCSSLHRSAGF